MHDSKLVDYLTYSTYKILLQPTEKEYVHQINASIQVWNLIKFLQRNQIIGKPFLLLLQSDFLWKQGLMLERIKSRKIYRNIQMLFYLNLPFWFKFFKYFKWFVFPSASIFKKNMNTAVQPCHNFYEFMCGNFKKWNPLLIGMPGAFMTTSRQVYIDQMVARKCFLCQE